MLPLVQVQHHMVPGHHPHLDPLSVNLKSDYASSLHQQPRNSRPLNPYQTQGPGLRAFPIRSSQPTQTLHRITTSFANAHSLDRGAEHSLRRKTPNGTIDNGYDGSMTHLASGPPPLKQIILPSASRIFPTANSHRAFGPSGSSLHQAVPAGWSYQASNLGGHVDPSLVPLGTWGMGGAPSGVGLDTMPAAPGSLLHPMLHHNPPYHAGSSMQSILGPGYNNSPAVYSPSGTYHQPGVWAAGPSEYGAHVPLANGYTPQIAVVDSAFMPAQATMYPGLANATGLGQPHPFHLPLSSHPLNDGFSRFEQKQPMHHAPHQSLEALSLSSVKSPTAGDMSSPVRFKERALAQAHKAYSELLLFLNHSKKAQTAKTGISSRPSKLLMFPKLPKQLTASLSPIKLRSPTALTETTATYAQHLAQKQAAAVRPFTFTPTHPTDSHNPSLGGMHGQADVGTQAVMAEILSNTGISRNPYLSKQPRPSLHDANSPVLNARASLELLTSLCEQSGWKWIDGILLGGCLQYGLEHYGDALEWFKRIVTLDDRHVEAISNIAATLYCLNRHDEAERHWVQAVKLRPSYLEAVEHLVGLLCSNGRNQEAVSTINFVQRTLRMSNQVVQPERASEAAASETDSASTSSGREHSPDAYALDADKDSPEVRFSSTVPDSGKPAGYGSSGYAIPGNENGRMLLLIHTKGNMLYGLKDIDHASEAFEEAVLISSGRNVRGVPALIRMIQMVLCPDETRTRMLRSRGLMHAPPCGPLLLPPDMAKQTAQLVFAANSGQLPGLRYIPEGGHKRTSISTTSNALLSLAKIFQDAVSNGTSAPGLMRQPTGVGDILALYYLSMSLQESPSTANNVGILLASVQQTASQQSRTPESSVPTTIPGIVPGSGLALALEYYNYGLSLDPKHVHLHTNLGSLLKDIGQLDMAITMYEKAVACDGAFDIALTNLANAVKDRGRVNDAIIYYKRAVASNPEFAEAVCGLSTALNSVCDWRGRGGVMLQDARFDRWHVNDNGMLQDASKHRQGSGLTKRVVEIVGRQLRDSATWGTGVLQETTLLQLVARLKDAGSDRTDGSLDVASELRKWMGRSWEGSRVLRLIERSTRAAMRNWYQDKYVRGITAAAEGYVRPKPPANLSTPSAPTVLPFHTFTCPLTAKDIRMISQRNALRISCSTLRAPWLPSTVYEPPPPPSPHLKIGYVSSDFNNHPLAHLMQSVFGFHDPTRAQAFCYATTASDRSIHRQQIEREAPVFRDVSSWSSDKLVDQIVADGIHILVNLNGYTRGARNEIFAARPAPIQMSFMGFAGTLGAEWCDYLLADATAIPPSTLRPHRGNLNLEDVFRDEAAAEADGWVYSENIIFCRDTFFCCDHAQSGDGSDERGMSWEEESARRWRMRKELFPTLPDDTIILGNFNQLYKIDPTTFRSWLRILAAVPKAVLWLLRFPELGESNLKRTARAWAGDEIADRIIFTDVAPKQQHISRARVCDLFLDTPECNAHTTAADVLWSSTPLLTLPRYDYKMCSRMAASILKGALPKCADGRQAAKDLIAEDDGQYENYAIKLGNSLTYRSREGGYCEGSGRLAELRKLLWKSKWTCALFDTRRWVRDLEDAYDEAWRHWVAGETGDIYL